MKIKQIPEFLTENVASQVGERGIGLQRLWPQGSWNVAVLQVELAGHIASSFLVQALAISKGSRKTVNHFMCVEERLF